MVYVQVVGPDDDQVWQCFGFAFGMAWHMGKVCPDAVGDASRRMHLQGCSDSMACVDIVASWYDNSGPAPDDK